MQKYRNFNKGFGLIEIIIVSAITTVALFGLSQSGIVAIKLLRNEKENLEATLLAKESLEAVRSLRDESWTNNISPLVNETSYYPVIENSKWKLTTVPQGLINGKYSRLLIFSQVYRDSQDKIASSGTLDSGTRKVTSLVVWGSKQTELVTYISNFLESLGGPTEAKEIYFEDATTDVDLASFPSNNLGDGEPAQGFTTLSSAIQITKVELYIKRTTVAPSDIYVELRTTPTGTVLGTSNIISGPTISSTSPAWIEFRFSVPVSLGALTKYYIRLRSVPASTDVGSGSLGILNWDYKQTASSPYSGGEARRYVGRLSNPNDVGQQLDQYDYGFRIYKLQ